MRMMRRIGSVTFTLLAVVAVCALALSRTPVTDATKTASHERANEARAPTTGQCGQEVSWNFEESTGVFTISPVSESGAMQQCSLGGLSSSKIKSVVINDGVTNICNSAFSYYSQMTSVTIPDSVTSIGSSAFNGCKSLTSVNIPDNVTSLVQVHFLDAAV